MKKFLVFLVAIVIGTAFAETINVNWKVGDTTYSTSTCESGGNLIIPQTPPTKYGYTFVGWNYGVITGTWSQSGTPTPTNPIEPVFYQLGDTVLRALGSGENFIADEYKPSTEKIIRRVGVKVLDGTEDWKNFPNGGRFYLSDVFQDIIGYGSGVYTIASCSHFPANPDAIDGSLGFAFFKNNPSEVAQLRMTYPSIITTTDFKQWLADQYAAGTPVTVYYPLAEPVEESWSLSE